MIGTCLTVTEYDGTRSFKVGIAPETLRRTNLGEINVASKVNLERAVAGHIRFGGHFVQVPPPLVPSSSLFNRITCIPFNYPFSPHLPLPLPSLCPSYSLSRSPPLEQNTHLFRAMSTPLQSLHPATPTATPSP